MLRFHVSNKRERQQFEHLTGPIEFGRGPKRNGIARCVIQDLSVSRDHVRIDEAASGQVRVENLSLKNPIRLADNSTIMPGANRELGLPLRLTVGETLIDIEPTLADPVRRESLETIAQPPRIRPRTEPAQSLLNLGGSPTPETLAHWFETVISVQRAAAGSPEFYDQTARALVDLVGLDRGLVLLHKGDNWEVQARCVTEAASGREFSYTILKSVLEERRTFFQTAGAAASPSESLQGVEAVVASPIFDPRENIVGALYGSRNRYAKARRHRHRPAGGPGRAAARLGRGRRPGPAGAGGRGDAHEGAVRAVLHRRPGPRVAAQPAPARGAGTRDRRSCSATSAASPGWRSGSARTDRASWSAT